MAFQRKQDAAALACAVSVGTTATLLTAMPASAQDMRVNVTGSNIKRVDNETASPIQVITREDIERTGAASVNELLQFIPSAGFGLDDRFTNGFAPGAGGLNIRNLGFNSTLILLNGKRMPTYPFAQQVGSSQGFQDLNSIPIGSVDRIEILKDGASAIYGADAVAGVVNIILREQYTGFTGTATGGATYQGDGEQFRAAVTAGVGDLTKDRYNAFITIDGQSQRAIATNNRRQYVGSNNLEFMGLPDARPGNPFSGFGTSSLVGNVRPVAATNPNGAAGAFQVLPGCAAGAASFFFQKFRFMDPVLSLIACCSNRPPGAEARCSTPRKAASRNARSSFSVSCRTPP